jgi:hypothetical protein
MTTSIEEGQMQDFDAEKKTLLSWFGGKRRLTKERYLGNTTFEVGCART